ncbi:hypothetical protein SRHO_G00227270 [Serrasalmus rhombeus]
MDLLLHSSTEPVSFVNAPAADNPLLSLACPAFFYCHISTELFMMCDSQVVIRTRKSLLGTANSSACSAEAPPLLLKAPPPLRLQRIAPFAAQLASPSSPNLIRTKNEGHRLALGPGHPSLTQTRRGLGSTCAGHEERHERRPGLSTRAFAHS